MGYKNRKAKGKKSMTNTDEHETPKKEAKETKGMLTGKKGKKKEIESPKDK